MNLEKKIKQKLAGTTLSIERLAGKAGITKQTLHNIFNKNDIKLSHLIKISEALNVDLSYFVEPEGGGRKKIGVNSQLVEESTTVQMQVVRLKEENKGLVKENELLREMIDILKKGK